MAAYYNEIDPYAAQWLRNLITAGHIAPGIVDERSIEDVRPSDLAGFAQCHFFAGIGIWSLALRRSGWADDRPVWTGSCPCQPFSKAGKEAGFDDERHLWPAWQWLIDQCRPASSLESKLRARLNGSDLCEVMWKAWDTPLQPNLSRPRARVRSTYGTGFFVANSGCQGLAQRVGKPGVLRTMAGQSKGENSADAAGASLAWFNGPDGKRRPLEPGILPMVDGAASRVGRIRAYGNGIDPRPCQAFIEAVMECLP